jgi:opacity protein-like surface antigen
MAALAVLLLPAAAAAQATQTDYTGFATAFLGGARGADVVGRAWTPGIAVSIVDAIGIGAELELSQVRDYDAVRFGTSSITSLMVNGIYLWPDATAIIRPYAAGGAGFVRASACLADCRVPISRSDLGVDVGGGVFAIFNELIGVRGDVRYVRFVQKHQDLPITRDNGVLDFWRTTLGVTISWPVH